MQLNTHGPPVLARKNEKGNLGKCGWVLLTEEARSRLSFLPLSSTFPHQFRSKWCVLVTGHQRQSSERASSVLHGSCASPPLPQTLNTNEAPSSSFLQVRGYARTWQSVIHFYLQSPLLISNTNGWCWGNLTWMCISLHSRALNSQHWVRKFALQPPLLPWGRPLPHPIAHYITAAATHSSYSNPTLP